MQNLQNLNNQRSLYRPCVLNVDWLEVSDSAGDLLTEPVTRENEANKERESHNKEFCMYPVFCRCLQQTTHQPKTNKSKWLGTNTKKKRSDAFKKHPLNFSPPFPIITLWCFLRSTKTTLSLSLSLSPPQGVAFSCVTLMRMRRCDEIFSTANLVYSLYCRLLCFLQECIGLKVNFLERNGAQASWICGLFTGQPLFSWEHPRTWTRTGKDERGYKGFDQRM